MSATQTRHLAITAALLLVATQAGALGTDAGTDVNNTATVGYSVGGISQTGVTSNTATFKVDRRILLTVAESGGAYTDVTPGSTAQVLTFTVTNDTNDTVDFRLTAAQDATGATDAFGGTDAFDAGNVQVFVDSNNNNTYDAGTDAVAFLDEVPEGATRTVFVVSDIPLGQANGDTAGVTLTAIAAQAGGTGALGSDWTQTAGGDTAGTVDTVFGDVAGDTDANRDGRHSDDDAYRVRTATLAVTKTSSVISDPFNGGTNPKRIPGAVVEYCITVSNTGATAADAIALTDNLPAEVTYNPGSLFTHDGPAAACTGGNAEDDDAVGVDEAPTGASESGGTVSATFATVPAGTSKAMRFRVTIN
jgi:uncharacterized repeat protein (TIGR01451 family)